MAANRCSVCSEQTAAAAPAAAANLAEPASAGRAPSETLPPLLHLCRGVPQRFGVGNWQKIVNDYPVLRQRTGVQLKDKVGWGCAWAWEALLG